MIRIDFTKYHGAGNDFIIIDGINQNLDMASFTPEKVEQLCHRNFGIGADGLMIMAAHQRYDFEMIYYNSDGHPSSMCGNGGRCIVDFAVKSGITEEEEVSFLAVDGPHEAKVGRFNVELGMSPVYHIQSKEENAYFLDTGSPHYVVFVDDLDFDISPAAHKIRYSEEYKSEGTNVNFVKMVQPNVMEIRTYERGVEGETLACGTGVTAAALAVDFRNNLERPKQVKVKAKGGNLMVKLDRSSEGWEDIWLVGPAKSVFKGSFEL